MIRLMPGVRVTGLKPEALLAMVITEQVFQEYSPPKRCEILSVIDGNHDGGPYSTSSHYAGNAFDVAVPEFVTAAGLMVALQFALGTQYFLSANTAGTHIHVSYMPTQP